MELADKDADAGEVVGVKGGQGRSFSGNDVWWTVVGIIFGAEREIP